MAEHSPEPWEKSLTRDGSEDSWCVHRAEDRVIVAEVEIRPDNEDRAESDARRIVACINACAGIPTEALESAGVTVIYKVD